MKISNIARICRKARQLLNGSAFSAPPYGHSGSALSSSEAIQLERDALATIGSKCSGRCRALGLLVTFGVLGTPRARIIRETVRARFKLLGDSTEIETPEIHLARSKAKNKLIQSDGSVRDVHGNLSNMCYIVYHAKWIPISFNLWNDNGGARWELADWSVSPDAVSSAIVHAYFKLSLVAASGHVMVKG